MKQANAGAQARLPVAWKRAQGSVSLDQSCAAASLAVNDQTTCTVTAMNDSPVTQTVDLTTTTFQQPQGRGSVRGDRGQRPHGAEVGRVPGRLRTSGVPSIAPGVTPAGYIPLDAFGIVPQPIGDEQIINFDVPSFVYNGVSHSRVGVDSNGYLIVGGGTSEDNNCCNLAQIRPGQPHPRAVLDRPRRHRCPGIFAATLTDGVNTWLVIEHRVNVFGTTCPKRRFQVWIGVDRNPGHQLHL